MKKLFFLSLILFSINSAYADDDKLINVNGSSEIKVTPDEAMVSLSIETNDKDIIQAQEKNDRSTSDLIKFIKRDLHIDDNFIQTSDISLRPVYSNKCDTEKYCKSSDVDYYQSTKKISVNLKKIKQLQSLLAIALKNGVNYINDVQFSSSQMDKYEKQAINQAVQDALTKAGEVAKTLGVKVGTPHNVNLNNFVSSNADRSMALMKSEAISTTISSISVGEITISANVNISFEIDE